MVDEVVLLIDPDELERRRLQRAFAGEGIELLEAETAIEGLFETLERDPMLILLAEQVPPLEAGELLLVLRRITGAPVIVIGSGDEPEESSALDLGADFYLRRPFGDKVALARARSLIRRYRGSPRNGNGRSVQGHSPGDLPALIPGRRPFRADPGQRAAS
jgi:DNA-binding response OmpR family regulator